MGRWRASPSSRRARCPRGTRGASYNFITLQYEDSYEGESLKYKDDIVKRNAALIADEAEDQRTCWRRSVPRRGTNAIHGLRGPSDRRGRCRADRAVAPEKVERDRRRRTLETCSTAWRAAVRSTHGAEDVKFGARRNT